MVWIPETIWLCLFCDKIHKTDILHYIHSQSELLYVLAIKVSLVDLTAVVFSE